ncbi:MAG: VanZ family protein [Chloroflexi bacterium]|nr:VanZ family protein [Chloroflexota bacterium]
MIDRIPVPIRIAAAVAWTALFVFLMLSPGQASLADDLSTAFGASELTDALGHLFMAFVETVLVFGALRPFLGVQRALVLTCVLVVALGAALELAQLWIPSRGATVLDFAAHCVGVGVGLWVVRRMKFTHTEA